MDIVALWVSIRPLPQHPPEQDCWLKYSAKNLCHSTVSWFLGSDSLEMHLIQDQLATLVCLCSNSWLSTNLQCPPLSLLCYLLKTNSVCQPPTLCWYCLCLDVAHFGGKRDRFFASELYITHIMLFSYASACFHVVFCFSFSKIFHL